MLALGGVRVLDLTHALAGPFCTYQLQLLGADVIKIERPATGDDFRDFARPAGWQVGPSFIAVNGGKRSITVDLKHPSGQEIVRWLASRADVVVENQRPGSLTRLGLDYDSLKRLNPRLVYCSLSGFGQTGEMRDWLAYDHTIQAMAGMMWNGGDDVPSQGRGFSVDCFAGYLAHAAILASLLRRERSGKGQYLDVAMLDAALLLMSPQVAGQFLSDPQGAGLGRRPTMCATARATAACSSPPASQVVRALVLDHWRAGAAGGSTLRQPACAGEARGRADHRNRGEASTSSGGGMGSGARRRRSACQRRAHTRRVLSEPYVRQRGTLSPEPGKTATVVGAGFSFNHDQPRFQGPVPRLGEHSQQVLAELGLQDTA